MYRETEELSENSICGDRCRWGGRVQTAQWGGGGEDLGDYMFNYVFLFDWM